jgi:hypothetical protein
MKRLFGGILLAVGVLIAGASGLCSLVVLFSGGLGGGSLSMVPLVALIGGIPAAIGVGLAFGGRALIRSDRQELDVGDTFD